MAIKPSALIGTSYATISNVLHWVKTTGQGFSGKIDPRDTSRWVLMGLGFKGQMLGILHPEFNYLIDWGSELRSAVMFAQMPWGKNEQHGSGI